MKTLTEVGSDIHKYLESRISQKRRKKSYSVFYTGKYPDYSLGSVTIDDFIEQVAFSIRGVYVEGGYSLDLYAIGGKKFCTKGSDYVFLTKEDCIKSLGEDPVGDYNKKRIQHYKNLYQDKLQKRNKLWNEIGEIENILLKLN